MNSSSWLSNGFIEHYARDNAELCFDSFSTQRLEDIKCKLLHIVLHMNSNRHCLSFHPKAQHPSCTCCVVGLPSWLHVHIDALELSLSHSDISDLHNTCTPTSTVLCQPTMCRVVGCVESRCWLITLYKPSCRLPPNPQSNTMLAARQPAAQQILNSQLLHGSSCPVCC